VFWTVTELVRAMPLESYDRRDNSLSSLMGLNLKPFDDLKIELPANNRQEYFEPSRVEPSDFGRQPETAYNLALSHRVCFSNNQLIIPFGLFCFFSESLEFFFFTA